jgi:hypothetical protein
MTRRELIDLERMVRRMGRPTGWRARASDRLAAVLRRIHLALEARREASTRWLDDRPGPPADDIEMQPEATR